MVLYGYGYTTLAGLEEVAVKRNAVYFALASLAKCDRQLDYGDLP